MLRSEDFEMVQKGDQVPFRALGYQEVFQSAGQTLMKGGDAAAYEAVLAPDNRGWVVSGESRVIDPATIVTPVSPIRPPR